jgi:hypothetical protein
VGQQREDVGIGLALRCLVPGACVGVSRP